MKSKSLNIALDTIIEEIAKSNINNQDKVELILNIREFLNPKNYKENKQLKEDIHNIINIINKNCDDLEATEEEFNSLDRWCK